MKWAKVIIYYICYSILVAIFIFIVNGFYFENYCQSSIRTHRRLGPAWSKFPQPCWLCDLVVYVSFLLWKLSNTVIQMTFRSFSNWLKALSSYFCTWSLPNLRPIKVHIFFIGTYNIFIHCISSNTANFRNSKQ